MLSHVEDQSDEQGNGWPELQPIGPPPLPTFPTQALPSPLREWVEAEAEATQTPAELAGILALSVCSAVIARKVEVWVPEHGWPEPVNLFSVVVLGPGNRKSAVFKDSTTALRKYEEELVEQRRPELAIEQSERRQAEKRLKLIEDEIAKLIKPKDFEKLKAEAATLASKLSNWPEPVLDALIVDDMTSEKLGIVLSEQNGRIACMSPEGDVFDLMAGKYSISSAPNFGTHLRGHAGDDLRVGRVGRESVFVIRPAITMALTVQPAVIYSLQSSPVFRGRGLLARFFYAVPPSPLGERNPTPKPVSEQISEEYSALVRRLLVALENINPDDPISLELSPRALESLNEWLAEIESELAIGGEMEFIQDWGAKLAGMTLRMAAALHCVKHSHVLPSTVQIEESTFRSAIELARYAIPHADRVLSMMGQNTPSPQTDAQYLWKWLTKRQPERISKRDLHRAVQRKFPKVEQLDASIKVLADCGYLREISEEKEQGKGRPASPEYEINPAAIEAENQLRASVKSLTQMTKIPNPPQESSSVISVNASGDIETQALELDGENWV